MLCPTKSSILKLRLYKKSPELNGSIQITGSKSESNRLLILQALYPSLKIKNLSNSHDSQVMQEALASTDRVVDIHHAGTAMRFLTAYFSVQEGGETILTGSKRMKERPVGILVDALKSMGADISFEGEEGCPPLRITGKKLHTEEVTLDAHVSSQYISALILVAPSLPNGLSINLKGKVTSVPYIEMTRSLLAQLGISTSFDGQKIDIKPQTIIDPQTIVVESDWSSASYYYSFVALSAVLPSGRQGAKIILTSYKHESLQGDSALSEIYRNLGVETEFGDHSITLTKTEGFQPKHQKIDLSNSPDIAQTIAVTCFGLGISCDLHGLHTLKIKETDRLEALRCELTKLGAQIKVTTDSLHLKLSKKINSDVSITTYQDHRMAMAFAPLALRVPILFEDAEVVNKSYPGFWEDLKGLGFDCEEVKV